MKTGHVPVLVVLIACAITLVMDVIQGVSLTNILKDCCIVLVIFFIIGFIAKKLLDMAFNPKEPEEEAEGEEKEDFPVEDGEGAEGEEAGEENEGDVIEKPAVPEYSEEDEDEF